MLLVDQPLPPYSYVPGKFPHPTADPEGHACEVPENSQPGCWSHDLSYLRGLDLFNHGFYWEAHEAWELAWIRCGRRGRLADFLKALIKLAAALVKAREGRLVGVQRHARRAEQLLIELQVRGEDQRIWGLSLGKLLQFASNLSDHAADFLDTSDQPVVRLTDFQLVPVAESEEESADA